MEQSHVVAQRWSLLVDPTAARSVVERISKLELPRRVCRPLDHRATRTSSAELAEFDASVDAAVEAETIRDETILDEDSGSPSA